ncbi:MAG: hypothetical protein MK321_05690, partial [Pseudomonadales bacterium]|nr:hypothetical protein [Pseudomonadales bacterium]
PPASRRTSSAPGIPVTRLRCSAPFLDRTHHGWCRTSSAFATTPKTSRSGPTATTTSKVSHTTSASYGFSAFLSSEGRVVISSTRSPSERYDPVFSRYFIEALDNRNGDRDKNNRVSMLEAFEYAKSNVEAWYEGQGRLASEHAGLDDNGDSLFALEPNSDAVDGRLAEIAYIDTLVDSQADLSREQLALKARMQELERDVFILRGRKADFLEADYWQQMEGFLVELARTTRQFNETLLP